MKTSIAITLIITATIFSFVSGYSIGSHNVATSFTAAEKAPAGGYGSPSVEDSNNNAAAPGYGTPSPGNGK